MAYPDKKHKGSANSNKRWHKETNAAIFEIHYSEEISLDELARSAGVSKSECLRCFKLSMQSTPYQYLTEYRLLKASGLLVNTELSMGEISNSVGFNSQSHFGKMFHRKTNLSPLNYRKAHTKNSNAFKK